MMSFMVTTLLVDIVAVDGVSYYALKSYSVHDMLDKVHSTM